MKLTFIGTGYVGLVSGVMMSYLGHKVTCLDIDKNKIDQLNNNQVPIYEPGLNDYINICVARGDLNFKYGYDSSLSGQDAFFITVGTPSDSSGGADLSGVYKAIDNILEIANDQALIIVKSTVPPGSSLAIQEYIHSKGSEIKLANNPEFLREGSAVLDFLIPDRIVIGSSCESSVVKLKEIYSAMLHSSEVNLLREEDQYNKIGAKQNREIISNLEAYRNNANLALVPDFVTTDLTTSEMIKYASNSFLANKIAFINEMSDLCENTGANINDLSFAVGLDRRIGGRFLKAGPGFGGSCFPKDILALQHLAREKNTDSLILDAVINANQARPLKMISKIEAVLGSLEGKRLTILGLTYKAGTDDFRSSPALEIVRLLKDRDIEVRVFDPMGDKVIDSNDNLRKTSPGEVSGTSQDKSPYIIEGSEICKDAYEACSASDAAIFITEWKEFENLDFAKIRNSLKSPIIIDLRHFLDIEKVTSAGLNYHTIGSHN